MSRPSSRAIYSKLSLRSSVPSLPRAACIPALWSLPPRADHPLQLPVSHLALLPPVPLHGTPAVHRKEYAHSLTSEPTHLQHRVEVSNPGPQAVS